MANQTFTLNFDAKLNVSQMKGALGQIQSTLNGLHLPDNITKNLQGTFNKLSEEVKNFEVLSGKDITGKADFTKLTNSANKIVDLFTRLKSQISDIGALSDSSLAKLFPDSTINNIQKAGKALSDYQNKIKSAEQDIASASKKVEDLNSKLAKENNKTVVDNNTYKQIGENLKQAEAEVAEYTAKLKELQEIQTREEERLGANKNKSSTYRSLIKEIEEVQQKLQAAEQQASKFAQQKASTTTFSKHATEVQKLQTELNEATTKLQNFENALAQIKSASDGGGMQELINTISQLTGLDMSKFSADAEGVGQAIQAYLNQELERLKTNLNDSEQALETQGSALRDNKAQVDEAGDSYKRFEDQLRDVSAVKSRIQYFFGLNNAINLVKRAIRGAVDTVKELDKAMTETAVVTNYTISDMWKQLPDYTKRANELGVTTKDAYEAATLYYQQGLNTEQAAALSTETLKMARIAGLEAADATDRMTNALRGFNMELNAMSAQRVDDVYSQLAAMSASNVDEISTAMTKVASLAHSANMEFETTAAFLAQIIETTRESAETAGTALKTVVARFSEVKKLYDMDELKGKDEEGQTVDVNKVSSALRTAGIDLNKYFLGEVGLDDIFMELASKWDSLTSVQQRYIATQAAGSRQQSRFIALMQDYARTQQLVSAAYNANGASARQFEKTQESLQSKLARLKNAWDQFLMGLTNNAVIKTAVDLLTGLLNVVNSLTEAFGTGVGSILKWIAVISAFSGIKGLFASGGLIDKGLMTVLNGTGIGNAAVKNGLLSGILFGNKVVSGSNAAETVASATGNTVQRTPLIFGSGSLLSQAGKGLSGGLAKIGGAITGKTVAADGLAALAPGMISQTGAVIAALGAVTAAIAAVGVAYAAWRKFSPEGQLKTAEKQAQKLEKTAVQEQENYKKLNSLQDTYKEKTEEINNTTNARDRQTAIQDRNEAILNAIKEDSTLAEYVITESVDNEIILRVDEKGLAEAAEKASETAAKAAVAARFGEANVDLARGKVAQSNFNRLFEQRYGELFSAEELGGLSFETRAKIVADGEYKGITIPNDIRTELLGYYQEAAGYRASAAQQAQIAYGQQLSSLGIKDNLVNALMPLLSESFTQTQNQLSNDELKSIFGTKNIEAIANAFSGALQSDKSLVNFNVEGDLTELLGVNIEELDSTFSQLETTLGLAEGTIKDTIKQNIKLQKQRQEEVTKQATMTMVQGNMIRPDSYSVNTMAKYLALEDFNDQQFVANLLGQIGNADYANLLINPIIDAMSTPGAWENSSLQQWIDSIDFSNPIQAFNALNNTAKDTESEFQSLANEILQTSGAQAQFSNSAQLSYLITSESYDSLSDSLSKFIEENGKITSANIEELAESNEDLNAILENNVTTAKGLAEILTHIENGTIQVWDLSDAVIAATAAMDDLDGIVESTIDDLNSFDAGFDENDITGFIQKAYKTINENLEKGAIGNNQNRTYLEKIFGDNIFDFGELPVDEWGRQYEQKVSQLTGILEANQENMYSAWQGVLGTYQTESGEQLQIFERDNEIFIEGARVTTDELINIVAKASGLGEQWARMMVGDYKNNSPDFAYQQGLTDLDEGIKIWADKLGTINGSKIYTDTDIHTLATLFNVDATAVKNAITELGDSAGKLKEIDFNFDKEGTVSGEDYIRTFEKLGVEVRGLYNQIDKDGNPIKELTQSTLLSDPNKIINFDQLKQAFSDAGLSNAFEGALNDCLAAGDHFVAEVGGQLRDIEVQAGETASDAYNRVVQSVADQQFADQIGKSVAEALSGLEGGQDVQVNFLVNRDEVDAFVNEKHETEGTVNWTNNYPGVPYVPNLERTVHWTNTGDYLSDAKGGIVQSYASGSENNKLHPGVALTGEEGPEIVWNKDKGYAYVTGENHPEFQNLQPGDRVFNAQETKKILGGAATGGLVPSFARGYGGATTTKKTSGGGSSSGSGSGSGGKDKTPEEWKNDLDWLYNLMEDIAELERDQKAIEEQYEDYLSDQTKTGGDLYRLLVKQLGNLYTQLNHQTFALEKREQEMREFMDITNDQDQYLWYNWQDRTLEIDWDAIDQITDEEQYKHVKELVDEAEEIQDKIDDADDSIMDITNQIQELENIWRDTFIDFEDRVLDAIIKSYQQIIDNYSELNDTLNNSNTQILDSLQKQISLERQIRDNTKTEEEISDEEARLAYLRRDTSGGNELAALQLEHELADQRENYEDTLVDQAISRLQEDNDAAAQQRERQIEIMQAQLDYQSENGEFNAYISELLTAAMGADGELLTNSDLVTLLKEQENWDAMSDVSKQVWDEELNGTFKEVAAFLLKENAEQNGTFYTALTEAVKSVSTSIGSYSQAMVKLGNSISSMGSSGGGGYSGGSSGGGPSGEQKQEQSSFLNKLGTTVATKFQNTVATATAYVPTSVPGAISGVLKYKKYATGGLAGSTGLAWLDGTPQEPEYVLNARQTDAFLKLADVLPSMMNGTSTTTSNTFGATYVNLSVNLESVSPDYDVDRMVDLVKDKLYDSSMYRNNNVLSFLR